MIINGTSRILLLILVVAMILSVTSCKTVEEADVVGTYVKTNEQPVIFLAGATSISLKGTEGKVNLQLKADGMAIIGDATLPWKLSDGKVNIYFTNASTSGKFKGNKIVNLGGEGIVWEKK